jgi:hypothetical protein
MRCGLKFFAMLALMHSAPALAITPNAQEVDMGNRIATHSGQHRASMVYHPSLNLVARAKALDLARRDYFAHVDPDGYGPNYAIRLSDYQLPNFWGAKKDDNFVESLAGGYVDVEAAFNAWIESEAHRRHVLGQTSFYAEQTYYGVGYASVPGTDFVRYYVFVSAPPDSSAALKKFTEWKFEKMTLLQMDHPKRDFDGDGSDDLLEYAFNMDPTVPSPQGLPVASFGEGKLMLRYEKDTNKSDIIYLAQSSTNLNGWNPADDVLEQKKGAIETHRASITAASGAYLRVQIQLAPQAASDLRAAPPAESTASHTR